jgi:hypothetical protein
MTDATVTHTPDALDKLAGTRAEARDILQPEHQLRSTGHFPRSATMRALTGRGAMSALALVGIALVATRPSIAARLARVVPAIGLVRQLGLGSR